MVFTQALDPATRAEQFRLDAGGRPAALLLGQGGRSAVLRFDGVPAQPDTLRWTDVRDARGTPVGETSVAVAFPAAPDASLILAEWTLLGLHDLELFFSDPLDPAFATDPANYRLQPSGRVVQADFDPARRTACSLPSPGA